MAEATRLEKRPMPGRSTTTMPAKDGDLKANYADVPYYRLLLHLLHCLFCSKSCTTHADLELQRTAWNGALGKA